MAGQGRESIVSPKPLGTSHQHRDEGHREEWPCTAPERPLKKPRQNIVDFADDYLTFPAPNTVHLLAPLRGSTTYSMTNDQRSRENEYSFH